MPLFSPRALGSNGCSLPDHIENVGGGFFVGGLSFYHFSIILSGACTVVVLVLIFGLMGRHAMRMSNPDEQLKIMRIINMIPSYQVLSFVAICVPNSYLYVQGFTEVFQGLALYSFLMLLCDFLAPTEKAKVEFFSSLEVKRQWQPKKKRNGLAFLNLTWWCVIQYPIVTWIAAVAQVVTQSEHVYCLASNAPQFAHIWITVITSLSTSVAVNGILQFYINMKGYLKEHRPLLKLLAFKLIVGVVLLEKIIFLILTSTKLLKPTDVLTGIDVMITVPTLVICVQMVPLSFLVVYAYRTKPYEVSGAPNTLSTQDYHAVDPNGDNGALIGGFPKRYQGGFLGWHAWAAYLNPLTLFWEVKSAHGLITKGRSMQKAQVKEDLRQQDTRYEPFTVVPDQGNMSSHAT